MSTQAGIYEDITLTDEEICDLLEDQQDRWGEPAEG